LQLDVFSIVYDPRKGFSKHDFSSIESLAEFTSQGKEVFVSFDRGNRDITYDVLRVAEKIMERYAQEAERVILEFLTELSAVDFRTATNILNRTLFERIKNEEKGEI